MIYLRNKNSRLQNQTESELVVDQLEPRMMLSTIQIIASGVEGSELMELEVDGVSAQQWTVGTGAYQGQFQTYTHNTPDNVNAGQVRIYFLNDLYDEANNFDRNLRVDAIVIDGVRFETEDPSVFSTGTWLAADGVQPGNRQSEFLHANGFFQYAGGTSGSSIAMRVRGEEGGEQFNLRVNNQTVGTYTATTSFQTFTFNASSNVTADQVRIEFTNDAYEPAQNLDRNLYVNFIEIDGQRFETEASDVFSTGTWKPEDGITPGFRESEVLHGNGYFQYAASGEVDGGEIRLVSSVYTVSEAGSFVNIQVIRESGSDGRVSIDYTTVDSSAVVGQDYSAQTGTIVWNDGQSGVRTISVPVIDDSQVEGNEQFSFTIDNLVGNASLTAPRTATINIDDNDSVQGNGDGLLGEYFNNINLTNRFEFRTDSTVDFNWGTGSPVSGMGANTFSARWTGQIEARYSENYTFRTWSDDGIRVWINDQLIINEWNDHAPTFHTGQVFLEAGVLNDIRIEYYENAGGAVAQLAWSSASQALEVVPQNQLYAADDPPVGNDLVAQTIVSGLNRPTAIEWSPDGSNMYIALQSGLVNVVHNGSLESTPFIDIRDIVNGVRDRGLLGMAVHPDFENNPYIYLLFTYDPPETANFSGLAGRDGIGNRAGRLIRVTANANDDYKTAVAGSEVVLLGTNSTWDNFNGFVNSTNDFNEPPAGINSNGTNLRDFIASDSESHTVGALAFGNDGNLFVSIGDGTSYNAMDPRTVRVQDIDNLSGKVLRIDPITGQGVSDNPFYNGDANANRSKVYQLGLRNPFRMSVDPVSGQLYIGDVGWTQWEEVNAGAPGANFGWPFYEGGSGVNLRTNQYQNLPEAQVFYASNQVATPAIYGLNHSATGINAIVLGDVYTGSTYPSEYQGDLFFNDLGQGIVRNISFDQNGNVSNVETFSTGAQIVVNIKQGPDGNLYYIDLNDGQVGRWVFV